MKIDNQDALKKWLIEIIEPIFEGDPEKLAQYIVALSKKVDDDEESKQRCVKDLEVFLETHTSSFVDKLFDALLNKSYEKSSNGNQSGENKSDDHSSSRRRDSDNRTRRRSFDRNRLSRDYQEIGTSRSGRSSGGGGGRDYHHHSHHGSSSHHRRSTSRNRRDHARRRYSSSSSNESLSPSSSRRRNRTRSRSPVTDKKQRCKDFDEKGFCTLAEMCPYDHGEVVIAPLVGQQQQQAPSNNPQPLIMNNPSSYNNQSMNQNYRGGYRRRGGMMNQGGGGGRYNNNNPQMYNQQSSAPPLLPRPPSGINTSPIGSSNPNRQRNLVNINIQPGGEDQYSDDQFKRGMKRSFNNVGNPMSEGGDDQFGGNQSQEMIQYPSNGSGHFLLANAQPMSSLMDQPAAFNTVLILTKVPGELNRLDLMRGHFSKFGQLVEIQCLYENKSDVCLVRFATNQQAMSAYKSPQPVLNNRFIRYSWLSHYLKQKQNESMPPGSQDEPSYKRMARDRLSYEPHNLNPHADMFIPNKENQKGFSKSVSYGSLSRPVQNQLAEEMAATADTLKRSDSLAKDIEKLSTTSSSTSAPGTPVTQASAAAVSLKAKQLMDENQKKAMQLKLELQKKARELIEQQIKDQKCLLVKFEQAKTQEEKDQIFKLIKMLSNSIDKEKELLKEQELIPTVPALPKSKPPPQHLLKLNNKRVNTTSFLKHGTTMRASTAPSQMLLNGQPIKPHQPSTTNMYSSYTSYAKVDNRPRQLIIAGLTDLAKEKASITNFINTLGCQIESVYDLEKDGETSSQFVISFVTRRDAEVALAKCSATLINKSITLNWYKQGESSVVKQTVEEDSTATSTKEEEIKTDFTEIESAEQAVQQ